MAICWEATKGVWLEMDDKDFLKRCGIQHKRFNEHCKETLKSMSSSPSKIWMGIRSMEDSSLRVEKQRFQHTRLPKPG